LLGLQLEGVLDVGGPLEVLHNKGAFLRFLGLLPQMSSFHHDGRLVGGGSDGGREGDDVGENERFIATEFLAHVHTMENGAEEGRIAISGARKTPQK
jgi:hypothetical protein